MTMKKRPTVRLQPRHDARVRHGHPWAFSNEIMMDAEAKAIAPGTPVTLTTAGGERLGVGFFNPHTLIAARVLTTDADTAIDRGFYARRIQAAAEKSGIQVIVNYETSWYPGNQAAYQIVHEEHQIEIGRAHV